MVRLDGWRDDEVVALLHMLRTRMTGYIYSTDEAFARSIQRGFRDKSTRQIIGAVRELMNGLAFAMKTRKFTNEVLVVDGTCVYPHEHLYETMTMQPENRQGGVWDPDDLRKTLRKMEMYRHCFDENPELFFARTQIWSKNVLDVRTKFYMWREIYVDESQRAQEGRLQSDAEHLRVQCLQKIFENVPPAPSPLPPTPSPVSPGTGVMKTTPVPVAPFTGKPPKMRMWTPEDLEAFVQLLVDITLQLHTKGTSPLIQELSVRLNRSAPSLLSKVQDIRMRFEKRVYHRAAEIPSVVFDKTSVAHKIFTSDWSDREDPYSMAIWALKDLQARHLKKRVARPPPPLQMEMRQRTPTKTSPQVATTTTTTPTTIDALQRRKPQIQPVAKTTKSSAVEPQIPKSSLDPTTSSMYSEFVRDSATMIKRDEALTHKLCTTMQMAVPLYEKTSKKVFYDDVAGAMGGGIKALDVFFFGERILRLCKQRYGSLDCFAAAVEGNQASTTAMMTPKVAEEVLSPEKESPGVVESYRPGSPAIDHVALSTASTTKATTPVSEEVLSVQAAPEDAPRGFGKSSEKAKRFQQKGKYTHMSDTPPDRTESSPSIQHYSSDVDHDELDDDADESRGVEDTPQREQVDDSGIVDDGNEVYDNENDDDQTQSLASSDVASVASSDYGHGNRPSVQCLHSNRYYRDSVEAPRTVHVSSRKTLVVKHAPPSCYCDQCGRKVPRRASDGRETVHRKRSRSELYAENGRWVEDHQAIHEIAHRHIHYQRHDEVFNGRADFDADPDEDMTETQAVELDSMWATLMAPIETSIKELEAKRQEQRERAADRERRERETHWKIDLREHVWAEWRDVVAQEPVVSRDLMSTNSSMGKK